MRIAFPDSLHEVGLDRTDAAVRRLTELIAQIRDLPHAAGADLEALATETVESAHRTGAILLAVVSPAGAVPAVLTGVVREGPDSWDTDTADGLRYSLENVGGPDVRETCILDTPVGPAVLVHRIPGVEQVRARQALALQLQAFIRVPESGQLLLLTLSSPSADGWDVHLRLFTDLVASASPSGPDRTKAGRAGVVVDAEEESFEHHSYRLG